MTSSVSDRILYITVRQKGKTMIKIAVGVVIGIAVMTTFPDQTADLSKWTKAQINAGAGFVVDQTKEQNLVDKVLN